MSLRLFFSQLLVMVFLFFCEVVLCTFSVLAYFKLLLLYLYYHTYLEVAYDTKGDCKCINV